MSVDAPVGSLGAQKVDVLEMEQHAGHREWIAAHRAIQLAPVQMVH